MKFALLSNVNAESIGRRIDGHEALLVHGYGAWRQELADPASGTFSGEPACIFLIIDGAEIMRGQNGLESMIAECDEHLACIEQAVQRSRGTKFFISTIDVPVQPIRPLKREGVERRLEQHWHQGIAAMSAAHANAYIFDLKAILEEVGRAAFYSNKRWYLGGLRYSAPAEKLIAKELERILDAQCTAPRKCLIVDLDNTLWGGVIGEDGLDGIKLSETGDGARYKDFQRRIRELSEVGVILAVVSKNNEADALEVFEEHEHMVLRKEDFAATRINWSPKAQNIAEVAQDLDISTNSFVFIDDNPVEREAIRTAMPEIIVPEFPSDTCELPSFLQQVYRDCFFTLESTEEDRRRTESYRANAKRSVERAAAPSLEEFLVGLRTKIHLRLVSDEELSRVAQLTQKTNQFNLTTRRYSEQDLQKLISASGTRVSVASVTDKYGDNGNVVVSIVRKETHDIALLDTFLMSCRVMGRFIEDQILDHLIKQMRADGLSRLKVQFAPTKKNAPAQAFVERLEGGQLKSVDGDGIQTWEFDIARTSPVTKAAYADLLHSNSIAETV